MASFEMGLVNLAAKPFGLIEPRSIEASLFGERGLAILFN